MRKLVYKVLGTLPWAIPHVVPPLQRLWTIRRLIPRRPTLDLLTREQLRKKLELRPRVVDIETSNICNARCTFCAYEFREKRPRIMGLSDFVRLLDRLHDYEGMELSFTPVVGDPLLDRTLVRKIRLARQTGTVSSIAFATNLLGLGRHDVRELLLSGLSWMIVSTSIGSRDMYRRVYGVDKYDTAVNNLVTLLQTNKMLGEPVRIGVHLKCEKPFSQVYSSPDYQRIVKLYGSFLAIADDEDYMNWTGLIDDSSAPKGVGLRKITPRTEPCEQLYSGLQVYADGTVGLCRCVDVNAKLAVGNLFRQNLRSIWEGAEVKLLRDKWTNGIVPEICRTCTMYSPLSTYIERQRRTL